MEDTSGFYKQNEEGEWLYAPNFVYSAIYELVREKKDEYNYPIDGWYWYDKHPNENLENQ